LAAFFLEALDAAEFHARPALRFVRRRSRAHLIVYISLQMETQLGFHVALQAPPAK